MVRRHYRDAQTAKVRANREIATLSHVFNMARGDRRAGAQARRRNASKEILEVLRENGFELKECYGIPSA